MDTQVEVSQTIAYGPHAAQRIYCYGPANAANAAKSRGLAILVHGGYWRAQFDASLMNPLAVDLCSRGWAVANIQYRRGAAESAWPDPGDDVDAAIRAVTESAWAQQFPGPRITVGHSVGGQLVLLSTAPVDGVVALAPVTDVARTYAENLAEGAVVEYFGAGRPDLYRDASPLRQPRIGTPTLVVHGDADLRVPIEHSRDYFRHAKALGAQIELSVQHGLDHAQLIDPQAGYWANVLAWMQTESV